MQLWIVPVERLLDTESCAGSKKESYKLGLKKNNAREQ